MSTSCCQRRGLLSPAARALLDDKLATAAQRLPEARAASVSLVSAEGRLLAHWENGDENLDVNGRNAGNVSGAMGSGESKAQTRVKRQPKGKKARSALDAAKDAADQSMLHVLGALQIASNRFANTLQVSECPIMHVKGDRLVFSCYAVGNKVLAMYSTPISGDVASYDTTRLDLTLQPLLEDLALTLQSVPL